MPVVNVRLFNERVDALVWVNFKVPAAPPMVKLDVDEPDIVPEPVVTAPFMVRVFEPITKNPLVSANVPLIVLEADNVTPVPPKLLLIIQTNNTTSAHSRYATAYLNLTRISSLWPH